MTKSELIERISIKQDHLSSKDVELSIKLIINHMAETLTKGHRIEIRGFGSFNISVRKPRIGRNPKSGEAVHLGEKHITHFKPSKETKERVAKVGW